MSKKTLVFDFDGVIHKGYEGWKDGSIYGEIDFTLLAYIKELMKDYYIVISSNRPAVQIVNYMTGLDCGIEFEVFEKDLKDSMYWNKDNVIGVTNEKAVGILYIDDRGYRYRDFESLQRFMEEIKNEEKSEEGLKHYVDEYFEKYWCVSFDKFLENVEESDEIIEWALKEVKGLKNKNKELKDQLDFSKLSNPEMNLRYSKLVNSNRRKINCLREENKKLKDRLNEEIERLNNIINRLEQENAVLKTLVVNKDNYTYGIR